MALRSRAPLERRPYRCAGVASSAASVASDDNQLPADDDDDDDRSTRQCRSWLLATELLLILLATPLLLLPDARQDLEISSTSPCEGEKMLASERWHLRDPNSRFVCRRRRRSVTLPVPSRATVDQSNALAEFAARKLISRLARSDQLLCSEHRPRGLRRRQQADDERANLAKYPIER